MIITAKNNNNVNNITVCVYDRDLSGNSLADLPKNFGDLTLLDWLLKMGVIVHRIMCGIIETLGKTV